MTHESQPVITPICTSCLSFFFPNLPLLLPPNSADIMIFYGSAYGVDTLVPYHWWYYKSQTNNCIVRETSVHKTFCIIFYFIFGFVAELWSVKNAKGRNPRLALGDYKISWTGQNCNELSNIRRFDLLALTELFHPSEILPILVLHYGYW